MVLSEKLDRKKQSNCRKEDEMAKIAILGGGGWAIGLSTVLSDNKQDVTMWSAVESEVKMLQNERENKRCLSGIKIGDSVVVTDHLEQAVKDKDLIILAVASSFVRSTAKKMCPYVEEGQIIVNVAKGIEESTLDTMTDIIKEEIPQAKVAVLSGPSHAEEVGKRIPTIVVVGAKEKKTAEYIQKIFSNDVFRVYTSPDMLGIEIGAALKNVIALAAGVADGIGCGDNTKAALITRGISEISELGVAMGGNAQTFSGLSGMGDLIVTCASMHSRNRRAGILIGQGKTMEEAMKEVNTVVEGVYSAKAAKKLSEKYQVAMPIIEEVNHVLFQHEDPKQAVLNLMNRDLKSELKKNLWNEK